MKRYHRSFLGLMEMRNDGDWAKSSEAQEIIDELEADSSRLLELNNKLSKTNTELQADLVFEKFKASRDGELLKLTFLAENIVLLITILYLYLR